MVKPEKHSGKYSFSDTHCHRLSEAKKGKKHPMWGKHHSEMSKRAISQALRGREKSAITRKRLSKALTGKKLSFEVRQKISQAHKGMKMPSFTKEHREKIGIAKRGANHPSWNGGSSFQPYPVIWTEKLKRQIRARDQYSCQICGITGNNSHRTFDVHHIDYDKDNCALTNLITLCSRCHTQTNFNRKFWRWILNQ